MNIKLVEDWRSAPKKYSVIAGLLTGASAVDQALPELLSIWQPLIPESVYPYAVALLATATIIGRLVKQS
jgi:hypothetical protein